MTTGM